MDTRKLLVCIPTYNEIENIDRIVPQVLAHIGNGQVLIIDDNSPDGTGAAADALAQSSDRIHVLHRAQKQGLGAAHRAAFEWGIAMEFETFIQFDADGSHHPKHLPTMISLLEEYQMVIASRRVADGGAPDWGFHRKVLSAFGTAYSKTILGVPFSDVTAGFNGFHRTILTKIDFDSFLSDEYFFQVELKYRCFHAGASYTEFPIVFLPRIHGKSKITPRIIVDAISRTLELRLRHLLKNAGF
ncbi:MAG: polyprenol monophosphomannose synthase [Deltaproteobacteria bacterium]|nr:polyprenol monophosphomannose synthase [Deltaproteobacteria bacterium]MBN2671911.1 polyprenol monophosphomannose synthase [Deltaproteobacteria bacterium]